MADSVFSMPYLPNAILSDCYTSIAEALPFNLSEAPVSAAARVVAETAVRVFNAALIAYSTVCVAIVIIPEFVIMNIDMITRYSLFSMQILKANWLFIKIVCMGLGAECVAFIAGALPYKMGVLAELRESIVRIAVAGFDELPLLAAAKNIPIAHLPDGGARLLNRDWRQELGQEMIALLGNAHDSGGEFWKLQSPYVEQGLNRLLLMHYTQAEVAAMQPAAQADDAEINQIAAFLQQIGLPQLGQIGQRLLQLPQENAIKEGQLAFHPIYYDALQAAAGELVTTKVYEKDDVASMYGNSFYGTMGLALLRLIQKGEYKKGMLLLKGAKGERLELEPFSSDAKRNFQSMSELLVSLLKGVDVTAFDAIKELTEEQIKFLRTAIKGGCIEPVVNAIRDPKVKEFAGMLRKNPRERHEFELWNMYEPKRVDNFSGVLKMTESEKKALEEALTAHSAEKIVGDQPQVVYAYRMFQHIIESVVMRRVINTNRYSAEQNSRLPNFQLAFAGQLR